MLGVVLIELRLLILRCLEAVADVGLGPGPGPRMVGSEPELISEFSSMLVSLEAVLRKLLTASLFLITGIFDRSLS